MSKTVLGISALYHDSAAAIVRGGDIIAAAQEERFSRRKHDPRFPVQAINYCLEEAGTEPSDLDAIVFYDKPLWTLDRVVENSLMTAPSGFEQLEKAFRSILGVKLWTEKLVQHHLKSLGRARKLLYTEHHLAHAASAFYPSPYREAAILTLDGVGEWATTTIGVGQGDRIELTHEIDYPHSLGLLYSAFTSFCGFKINSGEYKLMGLAPYGDPKYASLIYDKLVDVKPDGSYRLNTEYFGFLDGLVVTNDKFNELFGGASRQPESRIVRRELDLAASIQMVLEEIVLKMARHVRASTGQTNLVMAGGVALNCVANGKLLRENIFDGIWIQPASGDAGGALGSALLTSYVYFGEKRRMNPQGRDSQKGSLLGIGYSPAEVRAFLERHDYPYERIPDLKLRAQTIAAGLAEGKVIGLFTGRMEFGPRALGARSILGDPRRQETQAQMNLKIKYRESFRPFAPSVLAQDVSTYFEMSDESPYMLFVAPVRKDRQIETGWKQALREDGDLLHVINQARSDIPAVTHVDYSARVQSVHPEDNLDYYEVINAFKAHTGYGVIVNTSFNVRGEPIVCSPADAYKCFMRTKMDMLVLEDCLLWKDQQPKAQDDTDWRKDYELD